MHTNDLKHTFHPAFSGVSSLTVESPEIRHKRPLFRRILAALAVSHSRHRQRRDLTRLLQRLLRDMGLDDGAAKQQVRKRLWQI
jgi:uncharacterized protein YjiS (DUF1127 family)